MRRSASVARMVIALSVFALPCITAADGAENREVGWGEASESMQARVIAVSPETDEQEPDFSTAARVTTFRRPDEITLLVELKNIGEKPIVLRGVRYGDSVSRGARKSSTDGFAPHLFRCEFFDAAGTAVVGPANAVHTSDAWLVLSGGLAETLESGQSLTALLRPAKWDASVTRLLAAGRYTVRIHYRGPSEDLLEFERRRGLRQRFADETWTGDVVAGDLDFEIERDRVTAFAGAAWGEPVKGLRAAVEFSNSAPTGRAIVETASSTYSYGSRVKVQFLIENVSDHEICFWSEDWRQSDRATIVTADGKPVEKAGGGAFYTGWDLVRRWSLKPGQIAVLRAIDMGIASDEDGAKAYKDPIAATILAEPGEYGVRYDLRFNGWRRRDPDDNETIPGKSDWQETLTTGVSPFHVR